ncbi:MAG TPA: hypothetical protein VF647_03195 [Longimicrobium sp.]
MNRRRLTIVRERPAFRALEIVCTIVLCVIVYLLSTPLLDWVREAGGYTIIGR